MGIAVQTTWSYQIQLHFINKKNVAYQQFPNWNNTCNTYSTHWLFFFFFFKNPGSLYNSDIGRIWWGLIRNNTENIFTNYPIHSSPLHAINLVVIMNNGQKRNPVHVVTCFLSEKHWPQISEQVMFLLVFFPIWLTDQNWFDGITCKMSHSKYQNLFNLVYRFFLFQIFSSWCNLWLSWWKSIYILTNMA